MKKKRYEKPTIYFERFKLSQHIASCAFEPNSVVGVCGYIGDTDSAFAGLIIINDSTDGCIEKNFQSYCSTNGGDGVNTFNS